MAKWKVVWTAPLKGYATDGFKTNNFVIYRRANIAFDFPPPAEIRKEVFLRSLTIPRSKTVAEAHEKASKMKGPRKRRCVRWGESSTGRRVCRKFTSRKKRS